MSSNEQIAVVQSSPDSSRDTSSVRGVSPGNPDPPQLSRNRRPLLNLARKLHENETALAFLRNTFRLFQRMGITVSPNHYYWPVPDIRDLEARIWPADEEPIGMDLAFDRQLDFLATVVPQYRAEWESDRAPFFSVSYNYNNGFFETVDAEIAYCLVRHYKPRRIVEVGGGYSSRVMAAALDLNLKRDGVRGELVTIDPYPDRFPQKALSDRVHLIPHTVQSVGLDVFLSLQSGDFLFLYSSHVVGIGSDVVREYLEILPRVADGVIIHAHDIFIPADYPREAVLLESRLLVGAVLAAGLADVQSQLRSAVGQQRECKAASPKRSNERFRTGRKATATCRWRNASFFRPGMASACGRRASGCES